VVASRDLPGGEQLTDDDITAVEVPRWLAVATLTDSEAIGGVLRYPVSTGELLGVSTIGIGGASLVSGQLRADELAIAIPLDRSAPPLEPGDQVELIGGVNLDIFSDAASSIQPTLLATGRVLATDERAITVAVLRPDALPVADGLLRGTVLIALKR
jgi:Flp pilus assembly protein CpaB